MSALVYVVTDERNRSADVNCHVQWHVVNTGIYLQSCHLAILQQKNPECDTKIEKAGIHILVRPKDSSISVFRNTFNITHENRNT